MVDTYFAPAQRASPQVLAEEGAALGVLSAFCASLDAMPSIVLVLNAERQIVVANRQAYAALGVTAEDAIGKRPGELIRCANAAISPAGCGTSARCRVCGAVNAILGSTASGHQLINECRIMLDDTCTALDLEATATPFTVAGRTFTILSLRDISAQKRGEFLERLFFHDILNTAGNINGLVRIMSEEGCSEADLRTLERSSNQLLEELRTHRDLISAERGSLVVNPCEVDLADLLVEVRDAYQGHEVARGRTIRFGEVVPVRITTDPVLLRRTVGNLVKNAIEASPQGESVTLTLATQAVDATAGEEAVIGIHNPGVMPLDVQQQIFQRSFSTKGRGRGLGSYGARLFIERYLGGTIDFTGRSGQGTTVRVHLPLAARSA